jgi:hypothetical protein
MRAISISCALAIGASLIAGCAQIATNQALADATSCLREARTSPDGQVVYGRLWVNDETDTADKLTDDKPLPRNERDALVRILNKLHTCRNIIVAHDNRFAAWETPYWQEYFQRSDAIVYKLASAEISVGVANKLMIEGKWSASQERPNWRCRTYWNSRVLPRFPAD